MPPIARAAATVAATAAVIVVNALANALPINGQQTGEISDRFDVYFTPAGYVFSIWGLIYLALIAYSVYQALPGVRARAPLPAIAPAYWIASAANAAWILCWHYELFVASLAVMLVLLGALVVVYRRLDGVRREARAGLRWCVVAPFSLYLGWITVATIANVTVVIDHLGLTGYGLAPEAWTALVLAVAVAIAGRVAVTRRDAVFPLVLVWAAIGIYVAHPDETVVAIGALAAAALAALFAALTRLSGSRAEPGPR